MGFSRPVSECNGFHARPSHLEKLLKWFANRKNPKMGSVFVSSTSVCALDRKFEKKGEPCEKAYLILSCDRVRFQGYLNVRSGFRRTAVRSQNDCRLSQDGSSFHRMMEPGAMRR
jgi:hypothetical protein